MKEFTLTARYDHNEIKAMLPADENCVVYTHIPMEIIPQTNGLCLINTGFDKFEVANADTSKYVYASVLAADIILENQIIEDSGETEFADQLRPVVEKLAYTASTKELLDGVIKVAKANGKI